jgi:hypothetical protein
MFIEKAIFLINPDAKFGVINDDIDNIKWYDETNPIPKADIQAKIKELQTEYNSNKYQRDRAISYPNIKDQLDMMWHDKQNDTTTWEDAIAKVKSDNPKGGS